MSEDEIIDKINYMINNWHRNVVEIDIQWIQGLLDLYQCKKGRVEELKQELMQEKEKNKEIDLHYVPYEQYVTKLNEANEKWKDKIRAKIKELEKLIETNSLYEECWNKIEVLKELLEGE